MGHITWEELPESDDASVPTREDNAKALKRRPGKWGIIARCDRRARAETMAERINSGKEFGPGYEAENRQKGPEHRVYARFVGTN